MKNILIIEGKTDIKPEEEGKLRVDQNVSEIIDEFNNPMYGNITIFSLLTHTSGILPDPGAFFEPYIKEWDWFEKEQWIEGVLSGALLFKSGKEWRYSSIGFVILGEIIKRVSKMGYEKFIDENILKPLGMEDTYFNVPDEKVKRVSFTDEMQEKWFYERII
jgi:CubicO group peptidase (beta-lactamase class C family)